MTALLISEHNALDERVTIGNEVKGIEGTIANLVPGEQYTVGDLLSALLLSSDNDAAYSLAVHHSGTVAAFVAEMNARAASLGLTETTFANPAGLDASLQRSSPRDLAWLTAYAWRVPALQERMSLPTATITSTEGRVINLQHTHALLDTSEVLGGKTGTTVAAQQCLTTVVQVGSHQYVVVLLHSMDRYGDMRLLLRRLERLGV
jgi:serine-type D-Ala-D-Ala carboxypeptidase (penicillin-binding protein 5/6)